MLSVFLKRPRGHKIKEIYDLLDDEPLFNEEDFKSFTDGSQIITITPLERP